VKVLIVDDDPKYGAFVSKGLTESGILSDSAPDGETALARLRGGDYDLVLLDVMLPGIQGWDVIEMLKAESHDVPVIFVTARDGVDERVQGLRMGGDDYIVKPFAFAELVARVHAVMRRRRDRARVRIADLEIHYLDGTVCRAGRPIDLTRTEFALLRALARRAGESVSRAELLQSVWNLDFDPGTNVVDVHVRRLRKKIDEPYDVPLIHTVRGSGYVLEERP